MTTLLQVIQYLCESDQCAPCVSCGALVLRPVGVNGVILCDRPACHAAHIASLPAKDRPAAERALAEWRRERGGEQGKKPEEG